MNTPITIHVTAEDIEAAKRDCAATQSRAMNCPLAKAFQRHFNNPKWGVGFAHANTNEVRVELPEEAKRMRRAFDTYEQLAPGSFEISEPTPYRF